MTKEGGEEKDSQGQLDHDYLKILKIGLVQRFPFKSQKEVAEILGIHLNTYNNLLNNTRASDKTIERIADYCNVIDYKTYERRKPFIELIKNRLIDNDGRWVSYRLSSTRRLYESYWTFKKKELYEGTETIEVCKDQYDNDFKGEAVIGPDLTLNISLKAGENYVINCETAFLENFDGQYGTEFYKSFQCLVFESTHLELKQAYTSMEVLIKIPQSNKSKSRLIRNTFVPTILNRDKIPNNNAYLAFNYLTRFGGKTRRLLDNFGINERPTNGTILSYTHEIFISCPVSFIPNKKVFLELRATLEAIKLALIDTQGFKPENIYCELLNYTNFAEIPDDSRHLFFRGRDMIRATHYIALLPALLENRSSGVYSEIQLRILKKLPAMVFLENRMNLPSFLRSVMEQQDRPINIMFKDCPLERVPKYIKDSKEHLFQFVL